MTPLEIFCDIQMMRFTIDPQLTEGAHEPNLVPNHAGRLIEEVVELCLATGLTSGDIFLRVSDALQNEADKEKVIVSELGGKRLNREEIGTEIGDVSILLKYLAGSIDYNDLDIHLFEQNKINKMRKWLKSGILRLSKGAIYRRRT